MRAAKEERGAFALSGDAAVGVNLSVVNPFIYTIFATKTNDSNANKTNIN